MLHKVVSEISLFITFSFLTFIPIGVFTVKGIPSWLMVNTYSPVAYMAIPTIIISFILALVKIKPKKCSLKYDILKISLLSLSYILVSIVIFYTFIFFVIKHI